MGGTLFKWKIVPYLFMIIFVNLSVAYPSLMILKIEYYNIECPLTNIHSILMGKE